MPLQIQENKPWSPPKWDEEEKKKMPWERDWDVPDAKDEEGNLLQPWERDWNVPKQTEEVPLKGKLFEDEKPPEFERLEPEEQTDSDIYDILRQIDDEDDRFDLSGGGEEGEEEGHKLAKRFTARFHEELINTKGLQRIAAQTPLMLMPDQLKAVPTQKLAEEAFGLRADPEQRFWMMQSPATMEAAEEFYKATGQVRPDLLVNKEIFLESQRGDLSRLGDHQEMIFHQREQMRRAFYGVEDPPEGWLEKGAETAGGLTAFILRLATLNAVLKMPMGTIPNAFKGMVTWELENFAGGGMPGEGAAMSLGLGFFGAYGRAGGMVTKSFALGAESGSFAALAYVGGGDEIDIYIAASIPFAFRAGKSLTPIKAGLARLLRNSKSLEELQKNLKTVDDTAKKIKKDLGITDEYVPTAKQIAEAVKIYEKELSTKDKTEREAQIANFRSELTWARGERARVNKHRKFLRKNATDHEVDQLVAGIRANKGRSREFKGLHITMEAAVREQAARKGEARTKKFQRIDDLSKEYDVVNKERLDLADQIYRMEKQEVAEGQEKAFEQHFRAVRLAKDSAEAELSVLSSEITRLKGEVIAEKKAAATGEKVVKIEDSAEMKALRSKIREREENLRAAEESLERVDESAPKGKEQKRLWADLVDTTKKEIAGYKKELTELENAARSKALKGKLDEPTLETIASLEDDIKILKADNKTDRKHLEEINKKDPDYEANKKGIESKIKRAEKDIKEMEEWIKLLKAGKPIPGTRPKKGDYVSKGKIEGTDLTVGDIVGIGGGKVRWTVTGARTDTKGQMKVYIERSVTNKKGDREIKKFWAKPGKLVVHQKAGEPEPEFRLPPEESKPTKPPKPKSKKWLIYNLEDPKTFIVAVPGGEGAPEWKVRYVDGSFAKVSHGLVQKLIDSGDIVKLGDGVWGIPNERMKIKRTWLKEPDAESPDAPEQVRHPALARLKRGQFRKIHGKRTRVEAFAEVGDMRYELYYYKDGAIFREVAVPTNQEGRLFQGGSQEAMRQTYDAEVAKAKVSPVKIAVPKPEGAPAETSTIESSTSPVEVYHGGRLKGDVRPLTHFGSEPAARKAKAGSVIYKGELKFDKPIDMKDQGKPHRLASVIAKGIIEAGNKDVFEEGFVAKLQKIEKGGKKEVARQLLTAALTEKGYDVIRYRNAKEDPGSISYITLKPNQLKYTKIKRQPKKAKKGPGIVKRGLSAPEAKAVNTLASLIRTREHVEELRTRWSKLKGGKTPTDQMTGDEQVKILGPNVEGEMRTFAQAKDILDRRHKILSEKIAAFAPKDKPAAAAEGPSNLEQQRADIVAKLTSIPAIKLLRKPSEVESERATEYQQKLLLGGDVATNRTWLEVEQILRARLRHTENMIAMHGKKAAAKALPTGAEVLARLGPDGEQPVTRAGGKVWRTQDQIRFWPSRPTVYARGEQGFREFKQDLESGRCNIPKKLLDKYGNDARLLYEALRREKRIIDPRGKAGVKKGEVQRKARRKIDKPEADMTEAEFAEYSAQQEQLMASALNDVTRPERSVEGVRLRDPAGNVTVGEFPPSAPERGTGRGGLQAATRHRARAQKRLEGFLHNKMRDAFDKLLPHQQAVLRARMDVFAFAGPKLSDAQLMKEFGLKDPKDIDTVERQAILDLRIAAGVEPKGTTISQSFRRHNPYQHRKGMVSLYPVTKTIEIIGAPLAGLRRLLYAEARDMLENVAKYGGKTGRDTELELRKVAQTQNEDLGKFQKDHAKAQWRLNRFGLGYAGWSLQGRKFAKAGRVMLENGDPVSGDNWTIDRIADIVEGRVEPRRGSSKVGKWEAAVVNVIRRAVHRTGLYLERDVKLMITLEDGTQVRFRHTPGGKKFLAFPTTEMYDILIRGPQGKFGDGLFEAMERGYAEANKMDIKRVERIFRGRDGIRDKLLKNRPHYGYRHIGPELQRRFARRPTAIRGKNRTTVPIMTTEPRQVLDAVYTSAGVRGGFAKELGQSGRIVKRMRDKYILAGGNDWVFDNAIRTLSDIPPITFGTSPHAAPPSPGHVGYHFFRSYSAGIEVVKQAYLTATAMIQLSEVVGFANLAGWKPLMYGVTQALKSPESFRTMMDTLVQHRIVTKDVIAMTLDRRRATTDMLNKTAGVASRLHLNKAANEIFNERIAGLQSWSKVHEIMARGKANNYEGEARHGDVHWFRLLRYPHSEAIELSKGGRPVEEYYEAARRGARLAVGSTARMPEKSVMRNSRSYRFLVPFTGFFSNRFRTFGQHTDILKEDYRKIKESHGSTKDLKKMWEHSHDFAKFLIGPNVRKTGSYLGHVWGAGILATYIFAMLREGPIDGFKSRSREFWYDPVEFLATAFVWGSFGPLYGALAETALRTAAADEPAENTWVRMSRLFLPVHLAFQVHDMVKGQGTFKDLSGWDRVQRFGYLSFPVLHTKPGYWAMEMLGVSMEDPETIQAVKTYWTFAYDKDNGVVPGGGGSPAQRTDEEKQMAIHLKKAIEKKLAGDSGYINHLLKAFNAVGGRADLKSMILGKQLMNRSGWTDEVRRNFKRYAGAEKYGRVMWRDGKLRELATEAELILPMGRDIKGLFNELENLQYEVDKDVIDSMMLQGASK